MCHGIHVKVRGQLEAFVFVFYYVVPGTEYRFSGVASRAFIH